MPCEISTSDLMDRDYRSPVVGIVRENDFVALRLESGAALVFPGAIEGDPPPMDTMTGRSICGAVDYTEFGPQSLRIDRLVTRLSIGDAALCIAKSDFAIFHYAPGESLP